MRSAYSRSSISCTNDDKFSQLIPGARPPLALLMGGSLRLADGGSALRATTNLRPCSINEVSVRPSAAALRLAWFNSSCGNRTVVLSLMGLMYATMLICQYVRSCGSDI